MKMMEIVERRRDKIGRKYKRNTREAVEHSKLHPQELEEKGMSKTWKGKQKGTDNARRLDAI